VSKVGVGQLDTGQEEKERYLKIKPMRSRSPGYDDQWRGGRQGSHWLVVGVLEHHRGVDVGARKLSSPTIQGRRKETLNRSLTARSGNLERLQG
jgi:hypothetical protein